MYEGITTNIAKTLSNTLPEAENFVAKVVRVSDAAIGEVVPTLERSPKVDEFVKEVVESASPHININPVTQIKTCVPLDRNSTGSEFFGVTSAENIQHKLRNQLALTTLKTEEQNISNMAGLSLDLGYPYTMNTRYFNDTVKNLFETGSGRLTMRGKIVGGDDVTHTIGLVFDKKNNILYVLDSLPKDVQSAYRDKLKGILTSEIQGNFNCCKIEPRKYNGKNIEVIFSSKPQQQMNEYTCNNWTHANIESVQDAIKDGKILSEDELNSILPSDINEILKSQMNYLINDKNPFYSDFIKVFG